MPPYPRPADVEFDDAAAAAAVDELTAIIRVLGETEGVRTSTETRARADFRGVYADDFVTTSGHLDVEAEAALDEATALKSQIEQAILDAETERADVAAAQQRWDELDELERELRSQGINVPI